VFAAESPDIVHSRNWGTIEAIPAARLAGVKAVIHSEHGLEASALPRQPWRRKITRRVAYRIADRVFAVSDGLRAYYEEQLDLSPGSILTLPNGVDTARFQPDSHARKRIRLRLNATESTLVVGTVGRLDPVKDQHTLLLAAERALLAGVDLRVVLVGDGPMSASLKDRALSTPLLAANTVFCGAIENVAEHLSAFDVFVLPSLAEGMSNSLLEAMSVGVASIATKVGGNVELIEEGVSGLLIDPGATESLAGYLQTLATHPCWRRKLGRKARKRVEDRYSLQRMLASYGNLYQQTLGSRRTRVAVLHASSVPDCDQAAAGGR